MHAILLNYIITRFEMDSVGNCSDIGFLRGQEIMRLDPQSFFLLKLQTVFFRRPGATFV